MDLFYPKTRRPLAAPVKRPCPTTSPPTTPKHAKLTRPKEPPPLRRKVKRSLYKDVVKPAEIHHPLNLNEEEPQTEKEPEAKEPETKIASGPLKGVSTSLLDLIRAKEAKAKETSPEEERQRVLLGTVAPEVARIVPTVFHRHKKEILPYDKVIDKCYAGLNKNYASETIIECLDLMNKVAPEWTSTVTVSRGKYMRLNKNKYNISQLLKAIETYPIRRPK